MATIRPLHDEAPTKQDIQCRDLGADLYPDGDPDEYSDELEFGADPFDILAHKQESTQ